MARKQKFRSAADAQRHRELTPPTVQAKAAQPLSEDMIERERLAQARSAQLRKRLAPLYNKGPYQYITDDTDLSEIGKKL